MIYSGEWVYYITCGQKDKWHFVRERDPTKIASLVLRKGNSSRRIYYKWISSNSIFKIMPQPLGNRF